KDIAQKYDEALLKLRQRKAQRSRHQQSSWKNNSRPNQKYTETRRTETRYERQEKTPAPRRNYQSKDCNNHQQYNKLSDKEREERRKKNECFKCGKSGHMARDCRQKQVSSHSTTIEKDATPPASETSN